MRYVLLYETAPDAMPSIPVHFPAHHARNVEFHARGVLLMTGAFSRPLEEGAMAIFTTREAAEEFVAGDPFVLNGVVARWEIREWNEAFSGH